MIASLPMYWRAENAALWKTFWALVREGADIALPALTPPADLPTDWDEHWTSPELALSMTCGLPYRTRLHDRVGYVGTLDFGLDAPPGHYYSEIVARPGWVAGDGPVRLACNAGDSQSGWAAAQEPGWRYDTVVMTGSHAGSVAAVAQGSADVAFIDAVTWRLLMQGDPMAKSLVVVGRTDPTPGLPLITAAGRDPAPLRRALTAACACFSPVEPLVVGGQPSLVVLDADAYLTLPDPPALPH